ncbi:MAG: glycosyltransferase family 1 protein [Stygiobacter sp.]
MKIGIDAKWYFDGNPSGKVVIRNLIKEIYEIDDQNEIFIILDKKFKEEHFPFEKSNIKLIYVWSGVNLLSNVFLLPIVLAKYKLDVCIFQYFAPPISNFKTIVYIHDIIFKTHPKYFTLKERIYFSPMKFLARRTDGIVTVSKYVLDRIKQFNFCNNETKLMVVYNGISNKYMPKNFYSVENLEQIKMKYSLPERFLLYVGRLNERKNILSLLVSLNYIEDKSIKMVLCGKYDWKMFNLPEKIKELGLIDRVLLLGYISDEDLHIIYSLASIFCYVSFEEGFGLPPLESLASGVPVVVSNTSSLSEVCGDAGIYCNPYNPQDIAEKINLVLLDDKLREKKIKTGLKRSKDFNWNHSAKALLLFCEQICES